MPTAQTAVNGGTENQGSRCPVIAISPTDTSPAPRTRNTTGKIPVAREVSFIRARSTVVPAWPAKSRRFESVVLDRIARESHETAHDARYGQWPTEAQGSTNNVIPLSVNSPPAGATS